MKNQTLLLVPLLAGLSLAGCAARGGYGYGYVNVPPPAARVEVFGAAPGPGFVWVNGYWNWGGSRYAWVPGGWQRPPRRHARWEPGRWENHHGRYAFKQGRWR
jgi:hypothetical protein